VVLCDLAAIGEKYHLLILLHSLRFQQSITSASGFSHHKSGRTRSIPPAAERDHTLTNRNPFGAPGDEWPGTWCPARRRWCARDTRTARTPRLACPFIQAIRSAAAGMDHIRRRRQSHRMLLSWRGRTISFNMTEGGTYRPGNLERTFAA